LLGGENSPAVLFTHFVSNQSGMGEIRKFPLKHITLATRIAQDEKWTFLSAKKPNVPFAPSITLGYS
jgi:hypothetical protein